MPAIAVEAADQGPSRVDHDLRPREDRHPSPVILAEGSACGDDHGASEGNLG